MQRDLSLDYNNSGRYAFLKIIQKSKIKTEKIPKKSKMNILREKNKLEVCRKI